MVYLVHVGNMMLRIVLSCYFIEMFFSHFSLCFSLTIILFMFYHCYIFSAAEITTMLSHVLYQGYYESK